MHTDTRRSPIANERLLRLSDIVKPNGILPIARSTWLAGIKDGRYPKPIKLGPRIAVWRLGDIERLLGS
ncbi:helix-turn-helix transcriptional regulator [Kaistia soli]|uniref:helix-turn-helix transcriptional regulator n=1 Tax=Kaistia soli TaxID=446684 RepID=UPI0009334547|nr:AlpA family phage regulatory protein [Kaistia soli]